VLLPASGNQFASSPLVPQKAALVCTSPPPCSQKAAARAVSTGDDAVGDDAAEDVEGSLVVVASDAAADVTPLAGGVEVPDPAPAVPFELPQAASIRAKHPVIANIADLFDINLNPSSASAGCAWPAVERRRSGLYPASHPT
jgi:hypothetical protein